MGTSVVAVETTEIAARLKRARGARGLTMRELARRAELSVNSVSLLEGGHTTRCELATLTRLADALGCQREWLCWGTGRSGVD